MVIKPQFDKAYGFREGFSAVKLGERYGFIDKSGKQVFTSAFPGADERQHVEKDAPAPATAAEGDSIAVPELGAGDVLLCREYPYRTVRNTDVTMYQLARLGFADAKRFQKKYGLKNDNIIGPATQDAVREEYRKTVGTMAEPASKALLSASATFVTSDETCFLHVCVTNVSGSALRIRGSLDIDKNDQITCTQPSVKANGKCCVRKAPSFQKMFQKVGFSPEICPTLNMQLQVIL